MQKLLSSLVGFVVVAVWHTTITAGPILITNPSFEEPPVTDFNRGPIMGWALSLGSSGVWNINASPGIYWTVNAPDGSQIAFLSGADLGDTPATISQILSATLEDNTVYALSGQVGHPLGFGHTPNPDTVFSVELFAGTHALAALSGTGPEASFMPFQLLFDSTGSPYIGLALEIRLSSNQQQTGFDDLRLTAASVPEPSTCMLMLTGVLALIGYRRRRRQGEKAWRVSSRA